MKEWFNNSWKNTPHQVRKPLIFILGFTVVGVGIILLPLPGPGWLIIFAGFAILATEFEFADRVKKKVVFYLKLLIAKAEQAWRKIRGKNARG